MRYREIKPIAPLDQLVQCFWILEDVDNLPDVVERVVPDGSIELILHYGVPFQQEVEGVRSNGIARAIVAGQCSGAIQLRRRGAVGMIAARFHPATAIALLGGNMHELTDRILTLETVVSVASGNLTERIQLAGNDAERVSLLERWLLQACPNQAPCRTDVIQATHLIRASRGQADIAAIAHRLRISTRTLEREFKKNVGLTPKRFARIIRFRQVFDARARVRDWTWADVALRCGYTDQAHLIHEFRHFSGLPPTQFLREGGEMAAQLLSAPRNA